MSTSNGTRDRHAPTTPTLSRTLTKRVFLQAVVCLIATSPFFFASCSPFLLVASSFLKSSDGIWSCSFLFFLDRHQLCHTPQGSSCHGLPSQVSRINHADRSKPLHAIAPPLLKNPEKPRQTHFHSPHPPSPTTEYTDDKPPQLWRPRAH